jgi:uncharacterized protein (DUF2147 family)
MKKLYIVAALLMASTAAHAGNSVSFEIDGKKIHIEAPKNCSELSCIKISGQGLSGINLKGFKGFKSNDDDDAANNSTPPAPTPAPAPAAQVTAPQPVAAPVASSAPPAPATTVATPVPVPVVNEATPVGPAPVATVAPAPQPAPVAAAPAPAPTTPLGIWATEENKGNVRIEQCGQNLCGYAVNTGERILINMRPSESKWTGQIHDPDSGRNYDSTIAMKGTNLLKVQGCAFGRMFCGGQTWKRIS